MVRPALRAACSELRSRDCRAEAELAVSVSQREPDDSKQQAHADRNHQEELVLREINAPEASNGSLRAAALAAV